MTLPYFLPIPAVCLIGACAPGPGSAIPQTRSERQMLGLIEKFDRWDYNGDGALSAAEIDAGIATLKGTSRAVTHTGAEVVEFYDRNGDGSVSLREAQAGYHRTTQGTAAPLGR